MDIVMNNSVGIAFVIPLIVFIIAVAAVAIGAVRIRDEITWGGVAVLICTGVCGFGLVSCFLSLFIEFATPHDDVVHKIEEAYNINFDSKTANKISKKLSFPEKNEGEIIELPQSIDSDDGQSVSKLYMRFTDVVVNGDETRLHVELLSKPYIELEVMPTAGE